MKRTIMIVCVALAGTAAIAGTVAVAWPQDPHVGVHDVVHGPATVAHDQMVASDPPPAGVACPYGASANAEPSGCCGEPRDDAGPDHSACGGDR